MLIRRLVTDYEYIHTTLGKDDVVVTGAAGAVAY